FATTVLRLVFPPPPMGRKSVFTSGYLFSKFFVSALMASLPSPPVHPWRTTSACPEPLPPPSLWLPLPLPLLPPLSFPLPPLPLPPPPPVQPAKAAIPPTLAAAVPFR